MSTKPIASHVRITPSAHASNPINPLDRVENLDELMRRATLGTRLEDWEREVRFLKGLREQNSTVLGATESNLRISPRC